jgi:uncharacterized protein (TIGR03083 family)
MATALAVKDVPKVPHAEAIALGASQNEAMLAELRALEPADWETVTDCTPWTVRDVAAHLSAWAEAILSPSEFLRQRTAAMKVRKDCDNSVDAQNAVQVETRKDVPPEELIRRLEDLFPRFLKLRDRLGVVLRPVPAWNGLLGFYSLGYLTETIFTRDVFMHRADISKATGKEMSLGVNERRIVMDCVREWERASKADATLHLSGGAGGDLIVGSGGRVTISGDAIDFTRVLAGRPPAVPLHLEGDRSGGEAWLAKKVRF